MFECICFLGGINLPFGPTLRAFPVHPDPFAAFQVAIGYSYASLSILELFDGPPPVDPVVLHHDDELEIGFWTTKKNIKILEYEKTNIKPIYLDHRENLSDSDDP